ncbi:MAG: serine hydrolase domain-containing protein [Janthinobacterium lividum]
MDSSNSIYKLLFSAILMVMSLSLSAQNIQQKNDSVVVLIKNYLNTKNTDALYDLTDAELQHYISKKSFNQYLKKEVYSSGQIDNSTPVRNKTLNSEYKFALKKDTLLLTLNLDQEYKIRIFVLKKYIPVTPNKAYPVATSNQLKTDLEKKIDAVIRTYIQKPFTVGLSLGIIYGDKRSIYNYGEVIKDKRELPDSNTVFNIGSVSQIFTATLLADFVNEGKIKLTDPITKYLPDSVSENAWLKTVSVLSLSNHTSGLVTFPYYPNSEENSSFKTAQNFTYDQLFSYLKYSVPHSVSGTTYANSNLAFSLLAVILERISHKSYEELVQTIICKPLNLHHTAEHFPNKEHHNFAKFYDYQGKEKPAGDYDGLEKTGWLQSTMSDLLKYAEANMEVKPDDELSNALQLTHQITYSKNVRLGLGWHFISVKDKQYLASKKVSPGSSGFITFNAERKIAVVILSNSVEPVDLVGIAVIKLLQ